MSHSGPKPRGPFTIWSANSMELIPQRFRRIITIVMPMIYILLILFGTLAAFFPIPTFTLVVGNGYGIVWATCVAITSLLSLIGLIFKRRVEIYSSIILSILLAIYPFYIAYSVFDDPTDIDYQRLAVIFAIAIYPIMPAWRVFDISIEIRKSRQRQLYAESALGEA